MSTDLGDTAGATIRVSRPFPLAVSDQQDTYLSRRSESLLTMPMVPLHSYAPCASFLRLGMAGRKEAVEADPEVSNRAC